MDAVSSSLTAGKSRSSAKVWLAANTNVPNVLTAARALILPVIFFKYFQLAIAAALWISVGSALTDFLDGFLARLLKQETPFGQWFDSIVDKASNQPQLAMVLFFPATVYAGMLLPRVAFFVGVAGEIILARSRSESFKSKWGFIKTDSAQLPGKAKAWAQNFSIGFFLLSFMTTHDPILAAIRFGEAIMLLYGSVILVYVSVFFRLDRRVWKERVAAWFLSRTFNQ